MLVVLNRTLGSSSGYFLCFDFVSCLRPGVFVSRTRSIIEIMERILHDMNFPKDDYLSRALRSDGESRGSSRDQELFNRTVE